MAHSKTTYVYPIGRRVMIFLFGISLLLIGILQLGAACNKMSAADSSFWVEHLRFDLGLFLLIIGVFVTSKVKTVLSISQKAVELKSPFYTRLISSKRIAGVSSVDVLSDMRLNIHGEPATVLGYLYLSTVDKSKPIGLLSSLWGSQLHEIRSDLLVNYRKVDDIPTHHRFVYRSRNILLSLFPLFSYAFGVIYYITWLVNDAHFGVFENIPPGSIVAFTACIVLVGFALFDRE